MRYKSNIFDYNTTDYDKLTISQLKKQADYWLRQYLLKTTTGFGSRYWCPLKKQSYHEIDIHCCHFIDRGIMELRYDLKNVHLISAVSNTYEAQIQVEGYKSKHHKEYEEWLLEEYGDDVVKDLRERSKIIRVFQREDYIEVIEKFRGNE